MDTIATTAPSAIAEYTDYLRSTTAEHNPFVSNGELADPTLAGMVAPTVAMMHAFADMVDAYVAAGYDASDVTASIAALVHPLRRMA